MIPRSAWGEREVDALRRVRHAHVMSLLGYGLWPEQHPRYRIVAFTRAAERSSAKLLHPLVEVGQPF